MILIVTTTLTGMGLTSIQLRYGRMRGRGAAVVLFVTGMVTAVIAGKGTGTKEGTTAVL
jgi:hypothetical protein